MDTLFTFAALLMIAGFFLYNPVRKAWAPILGVGSAYVISIGLMAAGMLIGSIVNLLFGAEVVDGVSGAIMEFILLIVVSVACLGYMVMIMLGNCETAMQRVLLPFVCLVLTFGFCLRLMAAIFLHMPMENGEEEEEGTAFPATIYDAQGNRWECPVQNLGKFADNATYECAETGQTISFHISDFQDGAPTGFYRR